MSLLADWFTQQHTLWILWAILVLDDSVANVLSSILLTAELMIFRVVFCVVSASCLFDELAFTASQFWPRVCSLTCLLILLLDTWTCLVMNSRILINSSMFVLYTRHVHHPLQIFVYSSAKSWQLTLLCAHDSPWTIMGQSISELLRAKCHLLIAPHYVSWSKSR